MSVEPSSDRALAKRFGSVRFGSVRSSPEASDGLDSTRRDSIRLDASDVDRWMRVDAGVIAGRRAPAWTVRDDETTG